MEWGLIGNAWAVDLLRRQLARGTAHHAYLITGPEGVGRSRLALAFAQALLCEAPPTPGDWCGACRACRQVPRRAYADLHCVERLDDKQGITIEQVRDLQRHLALTSVAGGRRVAVLAEIEKASEGAANALLKTLEEPAPRVHLLLTASDVDDVAATIASRCELITLRPVPMGEIVEALRDRSESNPAAAEAAAMASGRPGLAVRLISDPALRSRRLSYAAELLETLELGLAGRFTLADRWKEDDDLEERLTAWLNLLGDGLRPAGSGTSADRSAVSARIPDTQRVRRALEAVVRTLDALRHNANARLALEAMMLDLPSVPLGSATPGYR